jgi:twitching motility two-component system response regulator PilG
MLQTSHYQAGQLNNWLEDLQRQFFSGAVYINAAVNLSEQPTTRVLLFKNGLVVYGGLRIRDNQEFASQIGKRLNHSWAETAVKYVAPKLQNPSSFYELLDKIVRIRVFKWEDVENTARTLVVQVLEQTLPYPGQLQLDPTVQCDLGYGSDAHGLDWYRIMQEFHHRQQEWTALTPTIPYMEAVPHLSTGGLRIVTDNKVQQHLRQWVDGKRKLVDIAEQSGDDPLALARSYVAWNALGWVWFAEDAPQASVTTENQQPLPIVLSVDDSLVAQALIKRSLSDRYHVILASNAVDALKLINTNAVELLLLDVTMPDIDGLEFCRTVRSIPKFKHLPIIMLTARDKFSDKFQGQIAGATHYLTKPVEPQQLRSIVEKSLDERKQKVESSNVSKLKLTAFYSQ